MTRQERRNELARAEGFANYHAKRTAQAQQLGYRSYGQQRAARAKGQPRPADTRAQSPRVVKTPAAVTAQTTKHGRGLGTIAAQLRRAGDRQVFVTATVKTSNGPRTLNLFGHGGWSAAKLSAAIADHGGDVGAAICSIIAEIYEGQDWAEDLEPADLEQLVVTVRR